MGCSVRSPIRNAHVHENDCRGLWADINAHDALIEHNLVEDNWAEGIFYEISQDAVIRNNRIYRNGIRAEGWYWDGGITVAASFNVEVYGNRLSGNYNGITGTQQDRPEFTPPAHLLDNLQVHDNLICATNGEHPPASAPTTVPTWPRATSASAEIPSSRPHASSGSIPKLDRSS